MVTLEMLQEIVHLAVHGICTRSAPCTKHLSDPNAFIGLAPLNLFFPLGATELPTNMQPVVGHL